MGFPTGQTRLTASTCPAEGEEAGPEVQRRSSRGAPSFQHRGQLVQRLVFGAFGDASQDFDVLVQDTATTGARKHWRKMQCKSPTEAFGIIVWKIRKDSRLIASGQDSASKVLRPASLSPPYLVPPHENTTPIST
jgi:hypothetical protein